MSIVPGRVLSHYRFVEKLGEGGMGAVWKAMDTSLDREVAIKILPEEVAGDRDRLSRFTREAKAVAALNHPNIVTVHSVEEADGTPFFTMELVEGETLEGLICESGLPVKRILELATPVADALAAAHEKGITHRDVKPGNIMVTRDGRVKVLDFGLAKLHREVDPALVSRALTRSETQEGVVMGTPLYMSPEQINGKPLDHRSDIFSFGIVLYEMATGARPFRGESTAAVISSILRDNPQRVDRIRADFSHDLARIIRRCLEKEPDRRYQSIKDVRNEFQDLARELDSEGEEAEAASTASLAPAGRQSKWHYAVYTLICLLAGAGITVGLANLWRKPPTPPQVVRFTIKPGPSEALVPGLLFEMAFSPDGASLAYMAALGGRKQLYLRRVADLEAKPIPGTEGARGVPVFSPDGQWLAFMEASKWKKVSLTGGPPVTMFDAPLGGAWMAAWGPDNTLVFGVSSRRHGAGARSGRPAAECAHSRCSEERAMGRVPAVAPWRQGRAVHHEDRRR